jgi:thiamine-phosphate pyrophosphorylase
MNNKSILRILDANLNRLKEALRVIEEIARLGKNHGKLAAQAKLLRHQVQRIVLSAPMKYREFLVARNSAGDVGRSSRIRDKRKVSAWDILVSNFKRAEESVRVLEEFFKLFSEKTSKQFQSLRFKIYTFEKRFLS